MSQLISIRQGAFIYAINLIFNNIISFKLSKESSVFLEIVLFPHPLIRGIIFLRA